MERETVLRQETLQQILKINFTDPKTKINNDALKLIKKYTDIFIIESILRTIERAKIDGSDTVELLQLEKVLPQLLFGFS